MGQALERAVRWFVAEGTGLATNRVIAGNAQGQRPKEPYASLLLIRDARRGYPIRRDLINGETADLVYRRAEFSLQFYRKGAADLAESFDAWAMSTKGLMQAETAFPDGKLDRLRLYSGGSGYTSDPRVEFHGAGGSGATATASVVRGAVAGVVLTARGEGFVDTPRIEFVGGGYTEKAKATAYGYGFRVFFPLDIQRLDEIVGDAYEERALINLPIDYATWGIQDAGSIDAVDCTVITAWPNRDRPEYQSGEIEPCQPVIFGLQLGPSGRSGTSTR